MATAVLLGLCEKRKLNSELLTSFKLEGKTLNDLMQKYKDLTALEGDAIRSLEAAMTAGADMELIMQLTEQMEEIHHHKLLALKKIRAADSSS